ncbi:MAG TPA: GNAT family N-acetyltransferase [Chryseolinea sp.]|nr:GNAT family N-acetyltransferase [Chryseolinea sp.]HPM28965.1 GNAT family N-acetyltransferase [Chryseolinea sp.]
MSEQKFDIEILSYRPEHQPWFEKLNRHWIEKYFWMEPIDFDVLQHPDEHIIQHGGSILMASYAKEIAGTVALKYVESGVYEFTKMAVKDKFQGLKIGKALAFAAIEEAKNAGAHKIILYSNRKLETAITLYRKIGFVEVPVDAIYKRSDIKMELNLDKQASTITVRAVTEKDLHTLREVAIQSFRDLLEKSNTEEDMKLYIDKNLTYEQLKKEFHEKETVFFLLYDGEKAMAYLKLRVGHEPEELAGTNSIEIERLYCIQEYVGKHIGKILMQISLDYAKEHGYEIIWLGVWEHNPRAYAFYQKWGFEKFGSHVFMLGTDAQTDWMMKRNVL